MFFIKVSLLLTKSTLKQYKKYLSSKLTVVLIVQLKLSKCQPPCLTLINMVQCCDILLNTSQITLQEKSYLEINL